jgi:hypothetical protein
MSLPARDRRENIELALKLLVLQAGSAPMGAHLIVPSDGQYNEIYSTTWHDLVSRGYLAPYNGFPGRLVFTGCGYRYALELHAMQDLPAMQEKLGIICKHLKESTEKRTRAGMVSVRNLAEKTTIPAGCIANIIEAQLIDYWLKRHGATLVQGFAGSLIMVPENFGLERL